MEKKNRYKNRIQWVAICRLALGAVLLLGAGAGFVLTRNDHVIRGNEIREIEDEIVQIEQEIEMWELRIAAVRDRQELGRRLRWMKSDLEEIDTQRVIELDATQSGKSETAVAVAY